MTRTIEELHDELESFEPELRPLVGALLHPEIEKAVGPASVKVVCPSCQAGQGRHFCYRCGKTGFIESSKLYEYETAEVRRRGR